MTKPCADGPVKFAHLCELDERTKPGSDAFYSNQHAGAQRVHVIRALHDITGSHGAATAALARLTKHTNIKQAQTRTLVRVYNQVKTGELDE